MAISVFKKINASGATDAGELSRVVTSLQDNVAAALLPIQTKLILDGAFVSGVNLITGNNTVQHKLGRKIIGYFVVSQSAASTFFDDIQSTKSATSFVLCSGSPCSVNLWVF